MSCPQPYDWRTLPNGDRCCGWCGSLHPADFLEIMYGYIESDEFTFSPSDKSYKIYAKRPGVRNASDGGIKFYTNHIDDEHRDQIAAAWQLVMPVRQYRFEQRWGKQA